MLNLKHEFMLRTLQKAALLALFLLTGPALLPNCFGQSTLKKHTIERGETLYGIARNYGISVGELKKLNNLKSNTIQPGDVLIVGSSTAQEVLAPEEELTPQGRFMTYTYKRGDRIDEILTEYKMDMDELLLLNPGLVTDALVQGSKINVLAPPDTLLNDPYAVINQQVSEESGIPFFLYADSDKGKTLSSGQLYNPEALTVAYDLVPLGSIIRLVNPTNGLKVKALVNDRLNDEGIRVSDAIVRFLELNNTQLVAVQ
jgi:LysM repeat protein